MRRHAAFTAAGIGLALFGLAGPMSPAYADGVIYLVGGHAAGSTPASPPASVPADDAAKARGVVLTGARLATASTAPRTFACADCGYATVEPIIRAVSYVTNVDPALVAAVIDVESGFNRHALSPAGAQGLMQLMPATAMRFGVSNASDPVQNVAAGSLYLSQLLRQFSGNLRYALAAYNAGEANVRSYGGIPPFAETQAYVPRVLSRYAAFKMQFGTAGNTPAAAAPPLHMMLTEYR
jgi:soluble lytic murein transglycosylase-like protein